MIKVNFKLNYFMSLVRLNDIHVQITITEENVERNYLFKLMEFSKSVIYYIYCANVGFICPVISPPIK